MREIVLDTETTGLSFKSGDQITEIGCTELINHIPTKKTLQFYCSVNKKVSDDALRISGLTNDFLNKFPSFKEQVDIFLNFIKEDTLIIHNAEFDLGFINNELRLCGKPKLKNKIIDTVSLARKTLNTRIANLDYLCRRFSIDLSKRKIHGALLDTQLLAEVYLELKGGKQISMNLSSVSNKNTEKIKHTFENLDYFEVALNIEEVADHKQSIKQIKNQLWEKIDY